MNFTVTLVGVLLGVMVKHVYFGIHSDFNKILKYKLFVFNLNNTKYC